MDFSRIFKDNLPELIGLLNIRSIYDQGSVNQHAPFGNGVLQALTYMKELALKYGFKVKEYDSKALAISYVDAPTKRIDIPCHIDVVEVDDSWDSDPFNTVIKEGKIIARGSYDMKVATYLTFLCLRLLKESYPETTNEIRLVIGTDEERTMDDMRYYLSLEGDPLFAYTPDGLFPMVIGEKGALMWRIFGQYQGIIETFDGGIQCNVVAPIARAVLKNSDYFSQIVEYIRINNIPGKCYQEGNKTYIEIEGKAVHSSKSYEGSNAICLLLKILKDVCLDPVVDNLYTIFNDPFGKGICKTGKCDPSGLTINLGILKINNGELEALVDGRYPQNTNSEELTSALADKCMFNVSKDYDDLPSSVSRDDPFVEVLLNNYRQVTKDYDEPLVLGSVSYSKVFKHCVGFGMGDKNHPMMAHQKNEFLNISQAIMAFEVYYRTMLELSFMEEK